MAEDTPQPRRRWKPWIKGLAATVAGLLLVTAAVIAFTEQILKTGLEWAVSTPTARLHIDRLRLVHAGDLRLHGVTLSDETGVWAAVPDLTIAWRPDALWGGTVHATSVQAARIDIRRWPKGRDEPFNLRVPALAWPDLPVDLRLDRLTIAALALPRSDGLADVPPLTLEAKAALDAQTLTIDARLAGPEGDRARLEARLIRGGAGHLALDAQSAADGQITEAMRAAGLRGLTQVRLAIGGVDPQAADWRAKVDVVLGGLADFTGDLALTFGDQMTLALAGDIQPGPALPSLLALPEDAAAPLMERQKLTAEVVLDDSGHPVAASLALAAASWKITARSDGADMGRSAAVTARLDQPPPSLVAPFRTGPVDITGTLSQGDAQGDGGGHADLRLTVTKISGLDAQIGRLESHITLSYDPKAKALTAAATGVAHDVKTPLAGVPAGRVQWTLAATGNAAAIHLAIKDAHDSRHRLSGDLAWNRTTSAWTGKGRLAVTDVRTLSQGLRSGPAAVDFTLARRGDRMTLGFSGAAPAVPKGDAVLDMLGPLTAKGQAVLTPLLQVDATLDSSALSAALQYDAQGDSHGTLTVHRGTDLKALTGIALADGTTADVYVQPSGIRARLQAPWLVSPDQGLRDATLNARLRGDFTTGRLAGKGGFLFTASTPVGPLRAASPLEVTADTVAVTDMVMDSPLATILGNLTYNRASGLMDGKLQGASGDLALLRRDFQVDAGGQLSLDLAFAATPSQTQALTAAIQGKNVTLMLEDRETVDLDSLDLDGRVEWGQNAPVVASGRLTVTGYRSALLTLDSAELTAAAADSGAIPWTFQAKGYYAGALNMAAAGVYAPGPVRSSLRLDRVQGDLAGRPVALRAPTALWWADDGWRLEDLELTLGQGVLSAAAHSGPDGQAVDARLENADLKVLGLATGLRPLAGTASGEVHWRQTVTPELSSSGSLQLALAQVDLAADQPLSPFDARLTMTVDGGGRAVPLKVLLEATGDDMSGRLDVTLPVTVAGDGFGTVPPDAPLSGRLIWRGSVAPLLLAREADVHAVDGDVVADLLLAGTWAAPEARGDVRLEDGRYENLQWGSVLENIRATLRLSGRRADIVELTATDGNGGGLRGGGYAVLGFDDVDASLRATLNNLRLIRTNEASARGSGDVTYERAAGKAQIGGSLNVTQADVSLAVKLPPEVADLAVREINVPAQLALTGDGASTDHTPAKLALSVSADRRVMVRGRGLDSEWRGDLKVGGDSDAPTLQGTLQVVRGDFDFAGKTFGLTEGTLRFTGGRSIDPLLLLRAEYETFDIKATLLLEGRLSQPRLTLTSVPSLPQDEVLARILFGTNAQSLSALEAVQLAAAVSALSSSGGGWDVFALARNALALDRLTVDNPHDVKGDRSAGPQVTGGKYLTDKVYLEVRTDTDTGQSNALLRLDVTRNLQLESSAGSDNDNRLGIRWKKDY